MSPIIYTPHDCEKPEGNLPAGTLYQCPECDRVWERGTDVFEDDTNLHWWVEEDPRRGAALQKACSQRTQPEATSAPDMVELVLDTYTDHMSVTPNGGVEPLGWCGKCETGIYGPHTIQAHAREKAVEALQDALDKAGRDAAQ
ncbi:hypothetical protein OH783_01665 [Kocuria rhizophila]|uniref:hypothetical protein n=1 Tax=Kocuria rhizophila TaxID=72000 RepID=UPI00386E02C1|nr:hypothetical protein OH783_01665 [Kocuria rhizophila]WSZ54144.1 hypothetical protein OG926_01665 [Kocuria rhizophila]